MCLADRADPLGDHEDFYAFVTQPSNDAINPTRSNFPSMSASRCQGQIWSPIISNSKGRMTNFGLRWGYIHFSFPAGLKAGKREIEGKELRNPRKKKPLLRTIWKYLIGSRISRPWVFFICSVGCWSAIIQGWAVIWKFGVPVRQCWDLGADRNQGCNVPRGAKPARRVSRVRPRPTVKSSHKGWILSQDSFRDFF